MNRNVKEVFWMAAALVALLFAADHAWNLNGDFAGLAALGILFLQKATEPPRY